jgi:hypothetical protein
MKRKLLFLLTLCIAQFAFAQAPLSTVKSIPLTFDTVELQPDYPGGVNQFIKYVAKNFKMPDVEGLSGQIKVTFIIEEDGSISDIKVLKDLGYGTADEAKRVVKSSPKWIPGEHAGKPVRVLFELPINIQGY